MRKNKIPLGVAVLLTLLVAGCDSDGGIAVRKREKSAVYTTLKLSEKRFIDQGVIAVGFTPDMVYMAMGTPSKVETKAYPEGTRELWTYSHYYPVGDAVHMRESPYSADAHYQPSKLVSADGSSYNNGNGMPAGTDRYNQGRTIGAGPPQGGTGEPADLESFTFLILFKEGRVARFGADPNVN